MSADMPQSSQPVEGFVPGAEGLPPGGDVVGESAKVASDLLGDVAVENVFSKPPDITTRDSSIPHPEKENPHTKHLRTEGLDLTRALTVEEEREASRKAKEKERRMDDIEKWSNTVGRLAEWKASLHKMGMDEIQRKIDAGQITPKEVEAEVAKHNKRVSDASLQRTIHLNLSSDPKYRRSQDYKVRQLGNGDFEGDFKANNYQYSNAGRWPAHREVVQENPLKELRGQMSEHHQKALEKRRSRPKKQ